ncbi:MAG: UDP-N-acetylmuramoyl-tripeptide--D-alanyl-D-alanine ligase, partial [Proteobacteria bacterium]|nr:UDP-N-acetylmuramoyl-tripeptide--D-alanyl-D-alanine ligase [Pseudomonadota bacterium]
MRFITDSNDLSVFLGQPVKKNLKIKGISIDTRTIKKEYLFIAIKGEVLDGNDYTF